MTFPTVVGNRETVVNANATSVGALLVNGSNVAGRLVILIVTHDGNGADTWPGSPAWTMLDDGLDGSSASRLDVRYRVVDGSEGWTGTDDAITVSDGSEHWVSYAWLISGQHASAPEAAAATGTTGNVDPAALTPSWGSDDVLWIVAAVIDAGGAITGFPANYTDNQQSEDTGGAAAGIGAGTCSRNLTGASDNPGAFTNESASWRALTIAVRPAAAVNARGPSPYVVQVPASPLPFA